MSSPLKTLFRYRLLAKPPFSVVFPAVTYQIAIEPVFGVPQWRLVAHRVKGRTSWTLCQGGEQRERLEYIIYGEAGFEVLHPTRPSMVLDRMCAEGQAEVTWPQHERSRAVKRGNPARG